MIHSSNSPSQINWKDCHEEVKKIKKFLNSLDSTRIGLGLMSFSESEFCLKPRSNYFDNTYIQSLSSIGDEGARFEKTFEGISQVVEKTEKISKLIKNFNPKNANECEAPQEILLDLICIEFIIDRVAKKGLEQLCENYSSSKKKDKAITLLDLGPKVFATIPLITKTLTEKLLPYCSNLEKKIDLEKYYSSGREILKPFDSNCEHLLAIKIENGLIIPYDLIKDWLRERSEKSIKIAFRFAVKSLEIPKQTKEISNGNCAWLPRRPSVNQDKIFLEPGIIGTCEKAEGENNLNNIFVKINSENENSIISCGEISTSENADQLLEVIDETMKKIEKSNGRWHIHTFSAPFEEKMIQEMDQSFPVIKEGSKKLNQNIYFSQYNTIFNDQFDRSEKALHFFTQLVEYALFDVENLLTNSEKMQMEKITTKEHNKTNLDVQETTNNPLNDGENYQGKSDTSHALDKKRKENNPEESGPKLPTYQVPIPQVNNLLLNGVSLLKIFSIMDEIKELKKLNENPLEDTTTEFTYTHEGQCITIKFLELQQKLLKRQNDLELELKSFPLLLNALIQTLGVQIKENSNDPHLKKALLIFKVLETVLTINFDENHKYSSCTKIELYLLFFHLLKINQIIVCKNGLDFCGFVCALSDTLSCFEKKLVDGNEEKVDSSIKVIHSQEELLNLILYLDHHQTELFKITNKFRFKDFIKDLTFLSEELKAETLDQSKNLRREVLAKINETHSLNKSSTSIENFQTTKNASSDFQVSPTNTIKNLYFSSKSAWNSKELESSLEYMEIFTKQLFTQMVKTLYSTGCAGFKWQGNPSWFSTTKDFTEPLKRLPPFIFTENGMTIQLAEFYDGWLSNSISLTPAGQSLLHRLSHLR